MIANGINRFPAMKPAVSLAMLTLVVLSGCGDPGLKRVAVTGVVTLDGKPVDNATIIFTPEGEGLAAAASIVEGKFSLTEKEGPTAGSHGIRINPNEAEMEEAEPAELAKSNRRPRIPKIYQQPGELVAEVTDTPGQELAFELEVP